MNAVVFLFSRYLAEIFLTPSREIGMESNEEIVARLKFLGHLQQEEKISVRSVNRQPNNWITSVNRTLLAPDNRKNTLKFVREVIFRTFELITFYHSQNQEEMVTSLKADLAQAQLGLENLKHTYRDDTKFCCDLEVLLQQIRTQLASPRSEERKTKR